MHIERWLQLSMAAMAVLGALILGVGQRNPTLPVLCLSAAVSSVYFTDVRRWLVLGRLTGNLVSVVVVILALHGFTHMPRHEQLLSLADLLVYLQCVLFFIHKNPRIYWLLALLSLMQVAVAAIVSLSLVFGVLLLVYLFVALLTLALFLIYGEQRRYTSPSEEQSSSREVEMGSPTARRWPLASARSRFTARSLNPSPTRQTSTGLLRFAAVTAPTTLLIAGVVFTLIPRPGRSQTQWTPSPLPNVSNIGFNEEVTLQNSGPIQQNDEEVMRVQLLDAVSEQTYQVQDELLFRGTVLTLYSKGRWRRLGSRGTEPLPVGFTQLGQADLVIQEIALEQMTATDMIFGIAPYRAEVELPSVRYDRLQEEMARPEAKAFTYRLLTTVFQNGRMSPLRPFENQPRRRRGPRLLLQLPSVNSDGRDPLAQLKSAADEVAGRASGGLIGEARALEAYFARSGRFSYTYSPPQRPAGVDPTEDFVASQPRGHCEFFASGLALMLRHRGIPSRVVLGFKGSDWNELGKFHQVRQRNAHAWVEALIPPEHLPPDAPRSSDGQVVPCWLTLDPTPAAEEVEAESFEALRQWKDYGQFLWSHFVLGMNASRQELQVYAPLRSIVDSLIDRQAWRDWFNDLKVFLTGEDWSSSRIINWRAALVAAVFQLTLVGIYRLLMWWRRRRRLQTANLEEATPDPPGIDFYRRYEQLLAALGLHRQQSETPREFALATGGRLADLTHVQAMSTIPRRVVDAFYRVRFGGQTLDIQEAQTLEQALTELEAALTPSASP